ncbi:MAG: hypothetical protein K8S99_12215 [Planctomycetes bacterium]|nr:hypothetical protein [Planctomycetota bacterium]
MALIANLAVGLSANTAAFTNEMNKAAATTRRLTEGTGGLSLEFIKGGAAGAILEFAGKRLNRALDESRSTMEALRKGELDAAEASIGLGSAIAGTIPVFGEYFKAGTKIGEMLVAWTTGSMTVEEFTTKTIEANKKSAAALAEYTGAATKARDIVTDLARARIQASDATPEQKQLAAAQSAFEDSINKGAELQKVMEKLSRMNIAPGGIAALSEQIDAIRAGALDLLRTTQNEIKATSLKPLRDQLDDFFRSVDQFGVTPFEAMRKAAVDAFGPGVGVQLDDYKARLDSLEESAKRVADAQAAIARDAKSVYDATRTPLEKHEAAIDRLGELLNAGAINWDTYARAVRAANIDLASANTDAPNTFAFKQVRFTTGYASSAPRRDTAEANTKAQLDVAKKQYEELQKLNNKEGTGVTVTVVTEDAFK